VRQTAARTALDPSSFLKFSPSRAHKFRSLLKSTQFLFLYQSQFLDTICCSLESEVHRREIEAALLALHPYDPAWLAGSSRKFHKYLFCTLHCRYFVDLNSRSHHQFKIATISRRTRKVRIQSSFWLLRARKLGRMASHCHFMPD